MGAFVPRDLAERLAHRKVRMDDRVDLLSNLSAFDAAALSQVDFRKGGSTIMTARAQTGKSAGIAYLMYKAMSMGLHPIVMMNTTRKLPMLEFVAKKVELFNPQLGVDAKMVCFGGCPKTRGAKLREFCARVRADQPAALLLQADHHQLAALARGMGPDDPRTFMEKCVWIFDEAHDFFTLQLLTYLQTKVNDDLNAATGRKMPPVKQGERLLLQLLGRWRTVRSSDGVARRLAEMYPRHIVLVSATSEDVGFINQFYGLGDTLIREDVAKNDAAGYVGHEGYSVKRLGEEDYATEVSDGRHRLRKLHFNVHDHYGKTSLAASSFTVVSEATGRASPVVRPAQDLRWATTCSRRDMHPSLRAFLEEALLCDGNTLLEPLDNTHGHNAAYNHALFVKRNFEERGAPLHALVVCGGDTGRRKTNGAAPGGVYEVMADGSVRTYPCIAVALGAINAEPRRRLWIGSTVADKSVTLGVPGFPITHMVYFGRNPGTRLSAVNQLINRMAGYLKRGGDKNSAPRLLINGDLYDDVVAMYRAGGICDKMHAGLPLSQAEAGLVKRHPIGHAHNCYVKTRAGETKKAEKRHLDPPPQKNAKRARFSPRPPSRLPRYWEALMARAWPSG